MLGWLAICLLACPPARLPDLSHGGSLASAERVCDKELASLTLVGKVHLKGELTNIRLLISDAFSLSDGGMLLQCMVCVRCLRVALGHPLLLSHLVPPLHTITRPASPEGGRVGPRDGRRTTD